MKIELNEKERIFIEKLLWKVGDKYGEIQAQKSGNPLDELIIPNELGKLIKKFQRR